MSVKVGEDDNNTYYNFAIDTSTAGTFRVAFEVTDQTGTRTVAESIFKVLSERPGNDEDQLVLFRYNNVRDKDNTIFTDGNYFYFRCEAAFFPQNETYNIEDNLFRDQEYEPTLLSAEASTTYGLTVGGKQGVPTWVADKLNFILSCTEVYIGEGDFEEEVVRAEGATLERTALGDMNPLYVFNVTLERTISGADYVKIGEIEPDDSMTVSPDWLEVSFNDTNTHNITVNAPDGTWIASLEDNSWAAVLKVGGNLAQVRATSQNQTDTARTQKIIFQWINPTSGTTTEAFASLTQASYGGTMRTIHFSGSVFYSINSQVFSLPLAAVSIIPRMDEIDVTLPTIFSGANGEYNADWEVSDLTYNQIRVIDVRITRPGFRDSYQNIAPPDFETATTNGITIPAIQLISN